MTAITGAIAAIRISAPMNIYVAIEFCIVEAPQPLIHLFIVSDHII
jgi:hypothetical protein